MPTYTYQCNQCGAGVEKRQSFSDEPLTVCEECGGSLRRIVHPVGIIFKGSGFHNTDYKKPSAATSETATNGKEAEKPSDSKDGAAPATKDGSSETKPAPAAPAAKESSAPSTPAPAAKSD